MAAERPTKAASGVEATAPMLSRATKALFIASGLLVLIILIIRTVNAPLTIDGWTLLYVVVGVFLLALPSLLPSIQTLTIGKDAVSIKFFKRLEQKVDQTVAKVERATAIANAAASTATENNELLLDNEARANAAGDIGAFEPSAPSERPLYENPQASAGLDILEIPIRKRANYTGSSGTDPNAGKFGRKSSASGRELTAMLAPIETSKGKRMRVTLRVQSTDPTKPLVDPVTFFLHPTFRLPEVRVIPRYGKATLSVIAWGAFTVGAKVDNGRTSLELNLADVPDAPRWFISR